MTITYFNLNGGDSDQWCTQFGVGWMIWTFPQSCLFITDAFWIWYLQSWLAVVTHLTAILKNHIYYSELKHYCEYMHLYILIWFIGLFFFSLRGSFAFEPLLVLCKWSSSRMRSNYRVISIRPSEDYSCIAGWTKGKSDITFGLHNCYFFWTLVACLVVSKWFGWWRF